MGKTYKVLTRVPWLTLSAVGVMVWAYVSKADPYAWYAWDSRNPTSSSTYFTYVLAHDGMSHLVGNLVMFGLVGWYLEMTLGRIRLTLLVTILTVASMRLEIAFGWFDTRDSDYLTGGVSSVVMGMTAAMAVACLFHLAHSEEGPSEWMTPVHSLAVLCAPLVLGINILASVQPAQGMENVAWGSHNFGWVFGLVIAVVLCFGTVKTVVVQWAREVPANLRHKQAMRRISRDLAKRTRDLHAARSSQFG